MYLQYFWREKANMRRGEKKNDKNAQKVRFMFREYMNKVLISENLKNENNFHNFSKK